MTKASDQDRSTRDRLVDATMAEIVERGWGGVRGRSVAARAGVNNALVHYHFGSMENLRIEAAAEAFGRLAESFSPDMVDLSDPAGAVSAMAAQIEGTQMDDPIWQVLMEAFLQAPREPRLAEMANGLLGAYRMALAAMLRTAIAGGALPEGIDVVGLAVALTAMLDGLGLHAYVDRTLEVSRAGDAVAGLLRLLADPDHRARKEPR